MVGRIMTVFALCSWIVFLSVECTKNVTLKGDEYGELKGGEKIWVLTNEGLEYRFQSFRLTEDELIGLEVVRHKGRFPSPVEIEIGLTDIESFKRKGSDGPLQKTEGTVHGKIEIATKDERKFLFGQYRVTETHLWGKGAELLQDMPPQTPLALEDISVLKVQRIDAVKTILLVPAGTGALIAGIVIIGIISGNQFESTSTSCPLVYSFDGARYRLDSETYAGAVFAGIERTDYDNLDYLSPVGGEYRLRISNPRPETQYTNELRLLVVDHPRGTEVVPDARGALHTLRERRQPTRAVDRAGRDVLSFLTKEDDRFWESDLASKDLSRDEDLRDGVILTFEKPAGAVQAKLLVHARNTDLAPFALEEFLKLQGPGLYRWYQVANRSSSLQERVKRWVFREGMLHVYLGHEGSWVLQDALLDVGPAISKDQVAILDLSGVRGNELRIKLESATGLWRIDAVAIDFSPDEPLQVTELAPLSARTQDGRDISLALRDDDDEYYIAVLDDVADVIFAEPPTRAESDRSYILKSKGFYYIYADDNGPARAELAERILSEPLAAAKYIVPRWVAFQKGAKLR